MLSVPAKPPREADLSPRSRSAGRDERVAPLREFHPVAIAIVVRIGVELVRLSGIGVGL